MTKDKINKPSDVDLANYNYLISIPDSNKTLLDLMALAALEEKYQELKPCQK